MDRLAWARLHPRAFFALVVGGTLLSVLFFLLELYAPVPPWHQEVVTVVRSEWAALPPLPGSTVLRTNLSAGFFDPETSLQVDYASAGSCAEAQAHYATVAPAAGWEVYSPLQSFHSNNPPLDELITTYHKYVRTFRLD